MMALGTVLASATDYPGYINSQANVIEMNGADITSLRGKLSALRQGADSVVRVLHIGDSHIQAEMVTNALRDSLQQRYGNAGRGLIVPLRLAGTNQPVDYQVTSPLPKENWTQTRLLKYPWPAPPGLTGVSAIPDRATTVTWQATSPGHKIKDAIFITSSGLSEGHYPTLQDSVSIDVKAGEAVYGAVLTNGAPGLLYSAIGNNGACYTDYSLIKDFAKDTRMFNPDLIVLSMGTNEGFSTMSDSAISVSVRNLITALRDYNPGAEVLVLLPMECQRNRNHGQRPLSPYYDINRRVVEAKDVILETARDMGVMTWDFYTIAGGEGASDKWLADGLMNKDRIHLYKPGYVLMAKLLYEALVSGLE